MFLRGGRALEDVNRGKPRHIYQTPNASELSVRVRLWGLSSMVAREKAQIAV
jgi:hypothetical protein